MVDVVKPITALVGAPVLVVLSFWAGLLWEMRHVPTIQQTIDLTISAATMGWLCRDGYGPDSRESCRTATLGVLQVKQ